VSATITLDLSAQALLGAFVQELHDFMASFPLRAPNEADWERFRQKLAELQAKAQATRDVLQARRASLAPKLDRLTEDLKALSAEFAERRRARMKELSAKIALQYEDLRRTMQLFPTVAATLELRKLKPINYHRNLFHVSNGLAAVVAAEVLLPPAVCSVVLAGLCALVIMLETARRFVPPLNDFLMDRVFHRVSRPRERHEVNSASWYTLALTLSYFLMPLRAVEVGVLVLAFADPAASIVGKRWGTLKLYREKSWLGTAAFALTAALVSYGFVALALPGTSLAWRLALAGTAAGVGALTELFSDKLDDNFTVLLLVAGAVSVLFF
jgi:dolichol kinase